ncbi:PQQ-dependent sugar dehydrogenase [Rubrivirga sp. IMCC43871]|uniref:PQQ-dependent sugar dehydrogenase n=1 Tax=Rubrivirga sp. IMCC43871 TaxID=3391575 RepID=UPI003990008E
MPRLAAFALLLLAAPALAQPQAVAPVDLDLVATLAPGTVALAYEPVEDRLYALTGGGDLYRIRPTSGAELELVATADDHGAPVPAFGLAIDRAGTIYLTGSRRTETTNTGVVRRGRMEGGTRVWSTVAETAPYPYGRTAYDHSLSAVAVSPDGTWLALNSGSRTDHGEIQDSQGVFPGTREVPLTSAILRVPTDATDLVLPADSAGLVDGGFLFADGTRNSFGLAFSPDGELFGAENAGDRDDGEELNWLREGHHYGFPWRIGTNDTPQRFPGYDPDADPLVDPASTAYQNGDFHDDPTYPAPPAGVTFTDPIPNRGPDADRFRQPDGSIVDASDTGQLATTFTPHRSPLGLVWAPAVAVAPAAPFVPCHALVLSWTDGEAPLLAAFDDPGEDLLCLVFDADYAALSATRIVAGFRNPIAAAVAGDRVFVAEFGEPYGLWAVSLGGVSTAAPPPAGVTLAVVPNPSRGASALAVTLVAAGPARVTVVDALGRTVALLHDGPLAAGPTRLAVPSLSAGVYLAVIEAGGGRMVRALTVVR